MAIEYNLYTILFIWITIWVLTAYLIIDKIKNNDSSVKQ